MRRVVAVAGILLRGEMFLAVERPPGMIMAGFWEFPGGKLEPGEGAPEALARELAEELGISGLEASFWRTATHVYTHGHITLHLFHVFGFAGEPQPLEGQKIRWVSPAEALMMHFLPADMPIVEELAKGGKMCDCTNIVG